MPASKAAKRRLANFQKLARAVALENLAAEAALQRARIGAPTAAASTAGLPTLLPDCRGTAKEASLQLVKASATTVTPQQSGASIGKKDVKKSKPLRTPSVRGVGRGYWGVD
ncbi:unnamed protein product [Symbiodinium sp. CCMP2592]|nr:unnamed protein product [Symbiodinium sp. CCMP2592]